MSGGYGKLFAAMYDGTLGANWQALVTFQQMIVLCDSEGILDMTPEAIARRTNIPLEIITEGIKVLEAPDRASRTPEDEGRRIRRLDDSRAWGWYLVNHAYYKGLRTRDEIRERERLKKQKQREKHKAKGDKRGQSPDVPKSPATHTQDSVLRNGDFGADAPPIPSCPHAEILKLWREKLSFAVQPRGRELDRDRKQKLAARWREDAERQSLAWWSELFGYIAASPFLRGESVSPGRNPFRLDMDWLLSPVNLRKVIEGKYDA